MALDLLQDVSHIGLLMAYDPMSSTPEQFIELIQRHGDCYYRSSAWIDFDNFKPFDYFLVFFVEARSNGKITAFAVCDRTKSDRTEAVDEYNPFLELSHTLPGSPDNEFRSYFRFTTMGKCDHAVSEFVKVKDRRPIEDLRILRSPVFVHLPTPVLREIETALQKQQ